MKKSVKNCLLISLITIVAGIVFVTSGAICGGAAQLKNLKDNGFLNIHIPENIAYWGWNWDWDFDDNDVTWNGSNVYKGEIYLQDIEGTNQVDSIKVEIGGGSLYIEETDSDYISVETKNDGKFKYKVEDGQFVLEGYNHDGNNDKYYLYLPAGVSYNSVEISIGAGKADVSELTADKIAVEIGAGKTNANHVTCNFLSVDVGAGKVDFQNTVAKDVELGVGMGKIDYEGTITGNLTGECSMGELRLALTGKQEDHNYDMECSAGNINLSNSSTIDGVGTRTVDNGKSDSTFDLECAMGNITVQFDE